MWSLTTCIFGYNEDKIIVTGFGEDKRDRDSLSSVPQDRKDDDDKNGRRAL